MQMLLNEMQQVIIALMQRLSLLEKCRFSSGFPNVDFSVCFQQRLLLDYQCVVIVH